MFLIPRFFIPPIDTGDDPDYYVLKENNEGCDLPVNSAPSSWWLNTAMSALSEWALNGDQPPVAERLAITDDMLSFQYDEHGNVLGGGGTLTLMFPLQLSPVKARLASQL
jgi:hypothetical protein